MSLDKFAGKLKKVLGATPRALSLAAALGAAEAPVRDALSKATDIEMSKDAAAQPKVEGGVLKNKEDDSSLVWHPGEWKRTATGTEWVPGEFRPKETERVQRTPDRGPISKKNDKDKSGLTWHPGEWKRTATGTEWVPGEYR